MLGFTGLSAGDRENMAGVGELGEELVSRWLKLQGWEVLKRRWRTQWGEIDLIALSPLSDQLAFVEVKTRNSRNWDQDGRLAVDSRKQEKLSQTAQVFLSRYPQWSELICRFDVALVRCGQTVTPPLGEFSLDYPCFVAQGYRLELLEYLEAAF